MGKNQKKNEKIRDQGPEGRHGKLRQKGETGDRGPGGHSDETVATSENIRIDKHGNAIVTGGTGQSGIGSGGGPGH